MCNLTIHGTQIDVTQSIREAAQDRLEKLKAINLGTGATLTFKKEGVHFAVHLIYHITNKEVVAKKSHGDLYVAINKAFDSVLRQLRKEKPTRKSRSKVPLHETQMED